MLLLLAGAALADLVLSKHRHGNGDEHRDELCCAARARHGDVPVERLIEDFVLPPIVWCADLDARNFSAPMNCSDRAGHGVYRLLELECRHGCRAAFDCAPLVARFWTALGATLGCMLLSIGVRLVFDRSPR